MSVRPDPFDLSERVAVVTGGSRGLGRALVLAFAERGADVVIASRKADACEALAEEVRSRSGRRALAVPCHVGSFAACDALYTRVLEHFGRADILVNNAGMSPLYPSLAEVSEELFDKVLAVNLRGPFRLSARFGTHMKEGAGGSILNISSIAAVQPGPGELPYAAAKAGLNNLTIGMARAFAPKVRVNCIMPGPFMTDISKAWPEEMVQGLVRALPLGRGGEPEEIVGAALALVGGAGSFTTGAIVKIDGGAAYAPA